MRSEFFASVIGRVRGAKSHSARIENAILCSNVRVGAHAQLKDCEFGPGYEVPSSGEYIISWTSVRSIKGADTEQLVSRGKDWLWGRKLDDCALDRAA